MTKEFFIVVAVIVLGLFGIFTLTKDKDENGNGSTTSAEPTNHTVGAGTKNVTLTEYGDFQCPHCKTFFDSIEPMIMEEYVETGQATFEYRNFVAGPLYASDGITTTLKPKSEDLTPKFGVSFQVDDDNLVYANAAQGVRGSSVAEPAGAGCAEVDGRHAAQGGGPAVTDLISRTAGVGPARRDSGRLNGWNAGGGARWFLTSHLAFTFDLRLHRVGAGSGGVLEIEPLPGAPPDPAPPPAAAPTPVPTPSLTFLTLGVGISIR